MAKEYIHLPEAKKRLVIGWPGNLQENKMAGDIERRTSQRHRAVQGTYVVTPAKIGHLIDISPEGLSFSSVDRGEWLGEPFEIEILAGDKEFYLGKIMACSVNADQNRNYQYVEIHHLYVEMKVLESCRNRKLKHGAHFHFQ